MIQSYNKNIKIYYKWKKKLINQLDMYKELLYKNTKV